MSIVQIYVVKRAQIRKRALALAVGVVQLVDHERVVHRARHSEIFPQLTEDGEVVRSIENDEGEAIVPGLSDGIDGVIAYVVVRFAVLTGMLSGNAVNLLRAFGDFDSGISKQLLCINLAPLNAN